MLKCAKNLLKRAKNVLKTFYKFFLVCQIFYISKEILFFLIGITRN